MTWQELIALMNEKGVQPTDEIEFRTFDNRIYTDVGVITTRQRFAKTTQEIGLSK